MPAFALLHLQPAVFIFSNGLQSHGLNPTIEVCLCSPRSLPLARPSAGTLRRARRCGPSTSGRRSAGEGQQAPWVAAALWRVPSPTPIWCCLVVSAHTVATLHHSPKDRGRPLPAGAAALQNLSPPPYPAIFTPQGARPPAEAACAAALLRPRLLLHVYRRQVLQPRQQQLPCVPRRRAQPLTALRLQGGWRVSAPACLCLWAWLLPYPDCTAIIIKLTGRCCHTHTYAHKHGSARASCGAPKAAVFIGRP